MQVENPFMTGGLNWDISANNYCDIFYMTNQHLDNTLQKFNTLFTIVSK